MVRAAGIKHVTFSTPVDIISMNASATPFPEPGSRISSKESSVSARFLVTFPPVRDSIGVRVQPTTFHELYSRYAEDVYRFAHWLSGNPDDARDITSETFVRVWTAPEEPRMDTVKAYLFAIARNLHRKQWRRQSRNVEIEETMPDPAASPDEAAAKRDDFRRAMAAVQTLPESDRNLLLLRAEGELSYEDIAVSTGLSVAAAKVRVFRARAKLAEVLKPKTGEDL
jgi:RNA polymerase sigma-70 factor (ECF subfamily)